MPDVADRLRETDDLHFRVVQPGITLPWQANLGIVTSTVQGPVYQTLLNILGSGSKRLSEILADPLVSSLPPTDVARAMDAGVAMGMFDVSAGRIDGGHDVNGRLALPDRFNRAARDRVTGWQAAGPGLFRHGHGPHARRSRHRDPARTRGAGRDGPGGANRYQAHAVRPHAQARWQAGAGGRRPVDHGARRRRRSAHHGPAPVGSPRHRQVQGLIEDAEHVTGGSAPAAARPAEPARRWPEAERQAPAAAPDRHASRRSQHRSGRTVAGAESWAPAPPPAWRGR